MTTWSERRGDEVFVYVRGRLIAKIWLELGRVAIFHVTPSFVRYHFSLDKQWGKRYH